MIQKYRALRRIFGLLLAAAVAVSLALAVSGLNTAGCAVFAGAFFAFGLPFLYYHEKLRRAPAEPPKPPVQPPMPNLDGESDQDGPMIFIAPLSAGLSKSMLYYVPIADRCVIRSPHSGHKATITVGEASEMLCENGNFYGVPRLGKAADIDFTAMVNKHACLRRVAYMESQRLPAEGEVRERQDTLGQLTEVYANGVWVPDAERSVIVDGMHDHFTAYRIQQAKLADEPKPPRPDRAWYDKTINKYRWSVPLEDSRTYFLTMFFDGGKKFLHYSPDVEKADDSHCEFTLSGEEQIRPLLAGPDADLSQHTKLLHELMSGFLKHSSGSKLETMVSKICTQQFHY